MSEANSAKRPVCRRSLAVVCPFSSRSATTSDTISSSRVATSFTEFRSETGRTENGRIRFATGSSATLAEAVEKEGYDGRIDAFAVYSPSLDETYVGPPSEAPSASVGLRIDEPEKRSPNVNWAEEFGIDCGLSSIE